MLKTKKKVFKRIGGFLIIFVVGIAFLLSTLFKPTHPEKALQDFYTFGANSSEPVGEDMLMDPLILAGDDVVPLVIEAVKKKGVERRLYAISFLGNGHYSQAIPTLLQLVSDETEECWVRGAALGAVYSIDPPQALVLAHKYKTQPDCLGKRANQIVSGKYSEEHRPYWKALLGTHD